MTVYELNLYLDSVILYGHKSLIDPEVTYKHRNYDPSRRTIASLNCKFDTEKINFVYQSKLPDSEQHNRVGKSTFCRTLQKELSDTLNKKTLMLHSWSAGLLNNPYFSIEDNLKNLLTGDNQFDKNKFLEIAPLLWTEKALNKPSKSLSEQEFLLVYDSMQPYDEIALFYLYCYMTGVDTVILDETENFFFSDSCFLYKHLETTGLTRIEKICTDIVSIADLMMPYVSTVISTNNIAINSVTESLISPFISEKFPREKFNFIDTSDAKKL